MKSKIFEQEKKAASNSLFFIAVIVAFISTVAIYTDLKSQWVHLLIPLRLVDVLSSLFVIFSLWKQKGNLSQSTMTRMFLLIILPLYPITWIGQSSLASSGNPWVPFMGYRIAFFVLAVCVVGPFYLNAILIGAFALETVGLWYYLDLASKPWVIATGEPLFTFAFGVIGCLLLFFHYKYRETNRLLAATLAKSQVLEKMAKVLLTIRDKSNTPLQTIVFEADMLRDLHPGNAASVTGIQNSVQRLKDLSKAYNELEANVVWDGTELFDIGDFLKSLK